MPTSIDIRAVSKHYGAAAALNNVSLTIRPGELFFLLGPSGCGKTTLLRTIAGFIEPTAGQVLFNGRDMSSVPPNRRNTGMVFQSYALWPHLTVAANVAFGLAVRRVPAGERAQRVADALSITRITPYAKRKPNELSGGQQQRVALARALVVRPDVLLLDEPLSNLDARLRSDLRTEIRTICKQYDGGMTTVYVTHDQKEALSMADRIALLRDGSIVQIGTPESLYHRPESRFAAEFLGETNYLAFRELSRSAGRMVVECALGTFETPVPSGAPDPPLLMARPEALTIRDRKDGPRQSLSATAIVRSKTFLGEATQLELELGDGVVVRSIGLAAPEVGAKVAVAADPDRLCLVSSDKRPTQPAGE